MGGIWMELDGWIGGQIDGRYGLEWSAWLDG